MTAPRAFSGDLLANIATLLVCVCALAITVPTAWNQTTKKEENTPNELAKLRGLQLDTVAIRSNALEATPGISLRGKRTIFYQFATDCPYCTAQKEFVASVLKEMQRDTTLHVITASDEPPDVTEDYWSGEGYGLPKPYSIHHETVVRLSAFTVPRLYFFNEAGTITLALEGSVLSLSAQKLMDQLPQPWTTSSTTSIR